MKQVVWLALFAMVLAACSGTNDVETEATTQSTSTAQPSEGDGSDPVEEPSRADLPSSFPCNPDAISSTPVEDTVRAIDNILGDWESLGTTLLTQQEIVPVLGPDGIPAIDSPNCSQVADVDFLEDNEAIIVVTIDGDVRGYPVQILTWHELVNDTVGGVPVSVAYCPLCNSAITYDRRVGDRVLDFGTSGALHQSSLVMYDRQTGTLWTHFDGKAVAGTLTSTDLEFFSTAIVSWEEFRKANPDAFVLNRDTGASRQYGSNPYGGYETSAEVLDDRFITNDVDPRLPAKEKVIGVRTGDEGVAVQHSQLFEVGVVDVTVAGEPFTVWNLPGASSALDQGSVANGIDVGSTNVFSPLVDGQQLTFSRVDGGFVDAETGSTWNIFGLAVDGELAGSQLVSKPFLDTFWFAWGTFVDGTDII